MKVKFEVMGVGYTQFHSDKKNRDYQRMRLMGFVLGYDDSKEACTADLAFNGTFDKEPMAGDLVVLDLSGMSKRNAMLELEFSSLSRLEVTGSKQKG